MSSALDSLGQLHIVTGLITVNTNTWTLVTNDGSATLTDDGAGLQSVNFVEPFLSAPVITTSVLKATTEATVFHAVEVVTVTTTIASFAFHHDTAATNTVADPDNDDGWYFVAIGLRAN